MERAIRVVLGELGFQARHTLDDGFVERCWRETLESAGPDRVLREVLARWAAADLRALVLLLDEADTLTGDALLSLLSQLRSGYPERRRRFPQSVVLCGIRDVRDCRAPGVAASPFNIKAESLRLGDFSEAETRALLGQHTEETGQRFGDEALELVWDQTRGQPWLVNTLAHEPDRERTRAPGAGVRDRSGADGPADLLAAGRRGGPLRGGVQGCAQGSGSGGPGGAAADGGLPGPAGLGERPLVVFDRNPAKSGEEKIYRRAEEYEGKAITVWGM